MILNKKNVFIGLVGFVLVLVLVAGTRSDEKKAATGGGLQGQAAAEALMDQWKRNNPDRDWVAEEKERHTLKPGADNSDLLKDGQVGAYTQYTKRDILMWARELEKLVVRGSEIFHDADLLGSSMAV